MVFVCWLEHNSSLLPCFHYRQMEQYIFQLYFSKLYCLRHICYRFLLAQVSRMGSTIPGVSVTNYATSFLAEKLMRRLLITVMMLVFVVVNAVLVTRAKTYLLN